MRELRSEIGVIRILNSSSLSFAHSTEETGILALSLAMAVDVGRTSGGGGDSAASLADALVAIDPKEVSAKSLF